MEFTFEAPLPASPAQVWAELTDILQVAQCVPGVSSVVQEEDGGYSGTIRVRVGPVGLQLSGTMVIEEMAEAQYRLVMACQAKDRKIPGGVRTRTVARLAEHEAGCQLQVETEAAILGKLGEFGQPVIRRQTAKVMQAFVANLSERLQATGDGDPEPADPAGQ